MLTLNFPQTDSFPRSYNTAYITLINAYLLTRPIYTQLLLNTHPNTLFYYIHTYQKKKKERKELVAGVE